ncbi:uncharacterized protein ARMOST_17414 [Armillaria ostoyae]|uniref:Uncharacterized protein n=1 Tax=Armillaria ostoyae TaxID=47428 RepID=A0A284RYW8_ARMOS|nr:uncharacterized protein ARMOST_17414 [Armillaria ostoyae]
MPRSLSLSSDPLSNFIVPGLESVPAPNKPRNSVMPSVPRTLLRLSSQSLAEFDAHVEVLGIDVRRFDYTRGQQAAAMNLIGHLDLYIPTHNEHDVQNKYSIIRTDSKFRASKKSKSKAPSDDEDKRWKRYDFSDSHLVTNDSLITSELPSMDSTQLSHDAKLTTALMELQRADDILFQALRNVLDVDASLLDSGQLDEYISVTMWNRLTSYKESGSISGLSTLSDRQQSINTSSEGDNKADIELGPARNTRNKKLIKFSPMIKEKRKEA